MFRTAIALAVSVLIVSPAAATKREGGQMTEKGVLTLYEGQKFEGETVEIDKDMPSISYEFTIGSVGVYTGETWELCEQTRYRGVCNILSSNQTGLGKIKIQSARIVRPTAAPAPAL